MSWMRLRNEVSEPTSRLDDLLSKLLAHPAHQYLQRIRIMFLSGSVDVLVELVLWDDTSAMPQQVGYEAIFELRQCDRHSAQANLHLTFVQRQVPRAQHRRSVAGGPTDDRAQSCEQFLAAEWLWEIIIGAGVDSVHPLGPAAARRQDQDRHLAAVGTPAFENREPVHSWQTQVKNDGAVIFGVTAKPGLLAVTNGLHHVSRGFEHPGHLGRNPGIVLDQKHAHLLFLDPFNVAGARVNVHL